MINSKEVFNQLVERAMRDTNLSTMAPVVEKELLHYDILFALDNGGLLKGLTFQGGTALRLCYGGSRFSEDLDFAGGVDFTSAKLAQIKECIETYIGSRYDLAVLVKEPSTLKKDPCYAELKIDKWQVSVVTSQDQKGMPHQKVKLEVANIPAYTSEPRALNINYSFMPEGYRDLLIETETLNEILADKMVSLSATQKYVRNRDLWDIPWLIQQGAKLDSALVAKKLKDYKIDNFSAMLSARITSLPDLINGTSFTEEMRRFIPADNFDRTLAKDGFKIYQNNILGEVHNQLAKELSADQPLVDDEFRM